MCMADDRGLSVRVTNLTDSPIQLYKNKSLSKLYPVDRNCDSHIRGVQTNDIITETVCKISGVIHDTTMKPKEWTTHQLRKELRIDDIKDVSEDNKRQLKDLLWTATSAGFQAWGGLAPSLKGGLVTPHFRAPGKF